MDCKTQVQQSLTHHKYWVNSLVHFKELKKIVSCSNDATICIWNFNYKKKRYQFEKVIVDHKWNINHLVKFSEEMGIFLSCSNDKTIRSFSCVDGELLETFLFNRSTVLQLCVVSKDLFVSLNDKAEIFVISYSKSKVLKKLHAGKINVNSTRMIPSPVFTNCFYFTLNDRSKNPVRLMNFVKDEVVYDFESHDKDFIYSITTFFSEKKKREILVCGGWSGFVYIYDTAIITPSKKLKKTRLNENWFWKSKVSSVLVNHRITSTAIVSHMGLMLLLYGDSRGNVGILDLGRIMITKPNKPETDKQAEELESEEEKKETRKKKIMKMKQHQDEIDVCSIGYGFIDLSTIHESSVRDICLLESEVLSDLNSHIVFASCSNDKTINIVKCFMFQSPQKKVVLETLSSTNAIKSILLPILQRSRRFFEKEYTKMQLTELIHSELIHQKFLKKLLLPYEKSKGYVSFRSLLQMFSEWYFLNLFDLTEDINSRKGGLYFGMARPPSSLHELEFQEEKDKMSKNKKKKIFGNTSDGSSGVNTAWVPEGVGIEFCKKSYLLHHEVYYTPIYMGEFKDGKYHGRGVQYNVKIRKKIFDGEFVGGMRDGKGIEFTYSKKEDLYTKIFEGRYHKGKRNGRGVAFLQKEGRIVSGKWVMGELDPTSSTDVECHFVNYSDIQSEMCIQNEIGSGGFGTVYKIRASFVPSLDCGKKKYVAVKMFNCVQNSIQRNMILTMIKRGIGLCSLITDSKYILRIIGIVRHHVQVGYIMELGKISVEKVISSSNNTLSFDDKVRILSDVAHGMSILHKSKIMHRDLKWSNVCLDENDRARLLDFDSLRQDDRSWKLNLISLTSRIGTQGYRAPEIFLGHSYGMECDVYSFGIMLYSLLFEKNQPYFNCAQCCGIEIENIFYSEQLSYHIANCNLRPPLDKKTVARLPKKYKFLISLMVQCWNRDPFLRPSFDDVVAQFEGERKKQKSLSLVLLRFPSHRGVKDMKMLLVHPTRGGLVSWIQKKFTGSKVRYLTDGFSGGSIVGDEDVFEMVQRAKKNNAGLPIVNVALDRVSESVVGEKRRNKMAGSAMSTLSFKKKMESRTEELEEMLRDKDLEMEKMKKERLEMKQKIEKLNLEMKRLKEVIGGEEVEGGGEEIIAETNVLQEFVGEN